MTPPAITGLLAALVKTSVIEPQRAAEILEKSRASKEPIIQTLINSGISSAKIAQAASKNFGLPQIELDAFDTTDLPTALVPSKHPHTRFQRVHLLWSPMSPYVPAWQADAPLRPSMCV